MNAYKRPPVRQRGAVLLLFVIAMGALLGVAGLALDMGHAYVTKTRLQNALDAAALSGAKTLKTTASNLAQSEADARAALAYHLDGDLAEIAASTVVEFSNTLVPFTPGGASPRYVRVRTEALPVRIWLASVLPGVPDNLSLGGSAVAGPLIFDIGPGDDVCNIVPISVGTGSGPDTDCSDGSCFGYDLYEEVELKYGASGPGNSQGKGNNDDEETAIGPGNFGLIELSCGSGADCVRSELAGSFAGCASVGGTMTSEPGNKAGPTAQGLNTRFGQYHGPVSPSDFPPDVVTTSGISYAQYLQRLNSGTFDFPPPTGVPQRRVVAVVFGDYSASGGGSTQFQVTGIGCFFLREPVPQGGHQSLVGEFVLDCFPEGPNDPVPGDEGFYKIILYKDSDGWYS